MTQAEIDAGEEQRRAREHAIMAVLDISPCPNRARKEYVHSEKCDALAAHLAGAKEMATVFVGRCPACDDFPEGPWTTVGEFACQCGVELYANLADGDDGAEHWSFNKAFEDEPEEPA